MFKSRAVRGFFIFLGVVVLGISAFFVSGQVGVMSYDPTQEKDTVSEGDVASVEEEKEQVVHLPTPEPVKAIYMTQCVAGTPSFRAELVRLIDETELNSVVIDIKDFSGGIGYITDNPELTHAISDACRAPDIKEFIELLHSKDIYVIGRITVFQDPYYAAEYRPDLAVKRASDGAVWKDRNGLSFIDVSARPFWDYIVELSKESYELGFDELNYDYIRFPSDGNLTDVTYPHSGNRAKADALEDFFSYLYDELRGDDKEGPKLSADLFGYTTTNIDDLGIGQLLERTLPYFDYVMPMVYPSHYNAGFIGIADPATHPYEVVKYSMDSAVRRAQALRAAKNTTSTTTEALYLKELANGGHGNISKDQLRPWLQDFNLGATYTPDMVRTQFQATYDAGLTSWALWDAGNTYTRAALQPE